MFRHEGRATKQLPAIGARAFLPCMRPQMYRQIRLPFKAFAASVTSKRGVGTMDAPVIAQVRPGPKRLGANTAYKRALLRMRPKMRLQVAFIRQRLITHGKRACKRPFPRVRAYMPL